MHVVTNGETCCKSWTRSLKSQEAETENDKTSIITVLAYNDE
jgi:hypothetical protein